MSSIFSNTKLKGIGSWGYGLEIISQLLVPQVDGIDTALYFLFSLSIQPLEIIEQIEDYGNDWAIKYSRFGCHHFTHSTKRGDNSSLGRTIHLQTQTPEFVLQRLERVLCHAPRGTVKILIQELIDQSVGNVVHAELFESRIELEVIYGLAGASHRVIATRVHGTGTCIESSHEEKVSDEDREQIELILSKVESCRDVLLSEFDCKYWSVEGFWASAESTLRLLQLRPAPLDRPVTELKCGGRNDLENIVFETSFVWGICNKEIVVGDGEIRGEGILSLCKVNRHKDWRLGYDASVLAGFASGSLDVVVRSEIRSASRLSHEPWFLPPPEYRCTFCHIWIPARVIAQLEGKLLRLVSDGNRARLVESIRS